MRLLPLFRAAALAATPALATGCSSSAAPVAHPSPSVAASASAAPHALLPISFTVDYTPVGHEVPFVYGVASGIYRRYGLNVHLRVGTGSAAETENAGADKITFGEADAVSVLLLRAQGAPSRW